MKLNQVSKALLAASACAVALVVAAGCAGNSASSASASSASASTTAASASASTESASASASSSVATSSSAAASSAASQAASSTAASQQASSQAAAVDQAAIDQAIAEGYQVFTGTVITGDAAAIIDLQKVDIDPAAAGGGGTYAVLLFDQPTQVSAMSADGSGERTETANMLGIAEHTDYSSFVVEYGDLDKWNSMKGQHVTIAAKAGDMMFPSDVRIPIGQPSAKEVKLLS